jgi:hypothetical protein
MSKTANIDAAVIDKMDSPMWTPGQILVQALIND